jgi:hypothetical protein
MDAGGTQTGNMRQGKSRRMGMLLTLGCVALVLAGPLLIGVPLSWLLEGRKPLKVFDWLLAPCLGAAAATLVSMNAVFLGWPIALVTPWVWAATGALWLWLLLSRRPIADGAPAPSKTGAHLRASLSAFPRWVLLAALLAYVVNGLGFLWIGARDYLGRAYTDQYNYTAIAQLLIDGPLPPDWETMGQQAYLAPAMYLKGDRIGAEALQGFLAVSIGTDAQVLFEPLILVAPVWIVLAVYGFGLRLGQSASRALVASLAAGVLPGVAVLHFHCFLSNVLAIPFVLFYLLALHDLVAVPGVGRLFGAALMLAAGVCVYPEFTAIFLGLTALCLGAGVVVRLLSVVRGLVLLAALPALAVAFNPLRLHDTLQIAFLRSLSPTAGGNPLDYLYNFRGLGCVWVGDVLALLHGWHGVLVRALLAALTALAVVGFVNLASRFVGLLGRTSAADAGLRRSLVLVLGLAALAALPLAVWLHDSQHPYQFQKLLLSFSPVLVVGVAHAGRPPFAVAPGSPRAVSWRTLFARMPLAALLMAALFGTAVMAWKTADPRPGRYTLQSYVLGEDWRDTMTKLRELRGENLILAVGPGAFFNAWPAYSARHSSVWLVNPVLNDRIAIGSNEPPAPGLRFLPEGRQLLDLQSLPRNALLLESDFGNQVQMEGDCHLLWTRGHYRLWQLGPGTYTLHPTPRAWPYPWP